MVRYNLKIFIWIVVSLSLIVFFLFYISSASSSKNTISDIWSNVGKTVAIVVAFSIAFNKWLWKWKYFHSWLVPFPNLNGKWKGTIHYYWDGAYHNKETEVRIVQSFLHIQVQIKTDESWSNSICSSFDIDEDKGIRQLIYSYLNVPKASVRERSQIHYGTASLYISDDFQQMEGNYWTDRKSQGELTFTKDNKFQHQIITNE